MTKQSKHGILFTTIGLLCAAIIAFCLISNNEKVACAESVLQSKQSEDYIRGRILSAYNQSYEDRERLFTSKSYYKLWQQVQDKDEAYFDYDHWLQAQDYDNPQVEIVSIHKESDKKASVVVRITDMGRSVDITFQVIYDTDDWYIDDFITEFDGKKSSEKELMRRYLAE